MTALVFAVFVWWTSNTIAHLFIHRPFFRRRSANRLFALGMSAMIGIPQTLWRDRHLAHHAGVAPRLRLSGDLMLQAGVVVALWAVLLDRAPMFFATVYVPGYVGGLLLCALHGHYEHAGGTISHYGRFYNGLLFNDGYHVEHHANPGLPWSRLPERRDPHARASAWPAPLRWIERGRAAALEALERLVLHSRALQRFVLCVHERALRHLIAALPPPRHIVIVGGGLFPRTALILRALVPDARLTIVDSSRENLDRARTWTRSAVFIHAHYSASDTSDLSVLSATSDADLLIVPLCFDGDREAIYRRPPARAVIVHDWIWRERGVGRVVSVALLKRVNLVTRGLTAVIAAARAIALAGHGIPVSLWSPIAFLWHDAAVLLLFFAFERAAAAARAAVISVYATIVLYVALNVPVTRVLSTPLTKTMWRAARGPLADSILRYATWDNVLLTMTIVALGIGLPIGLTRWTVRDRLRYRHFLLAPLIGLVILGPIAASRVDTRGLERNAWTALAITAMATARASARDDPWTATGFEDADDAALEPFRGAAAGRNIVMVSLESTAAQYLGLYGATPDATPNVTELANHAIVFDHAYSVYPESIKGLFSVLCSAYPALDVPVEAYTAASCTSIADVLGHSGYRTALFHSGRFGYLGMASIVRGRGYDLLEDAGDIGGERESSFGVDEPSTVERVLSWIDTLAAGERFFVTYLPIAGHHPYETPERGPFPDRTDADRYRNALHYGDAALGIMIRGLRARGLEERVLWVIFGDHGEAFGQHDGNYGHTFQIFDENVRVPFIIAAPGLVPRQRRSARVVSLIDTAPTLLDAIGTRPPDVYQGRSMLDARPRMAFFFTDYSLELLGLRDGRFKTIYEPGSGRARLFDVERDPHETTDLSDQHAARTRWYARNLQRWSAAQQRRFSASSSSLR